MFGVSESHCYRDGILKSSQPELSCCPCRPHCGPIGCSGLWAESSMVAGAQLLLLGAKGCDILLCPWGCRYHQPWLVDCGRTDATRG